MSNGAENSFYEKCVLKSAEILKNKKTIFNCWLTKHGSLFDEGGTDLIIELYGGIAVYIQIIAGGGSEIHSSVSNSNHGSIQKHLKKHPNIKNVIVVPRRLLRNTKEPSIYEKITRELNSIINKAIREAKGE